ncbi:MAG TPA: PadR family transcriptional regulator [Candidatus Binataceae bacterium]|nr:PadR family transcriptional regulator [Candidatus Binataceae bacterium]
MKSVLPQPAAQFARNHATPRMDVKFPILGFLMDCELSGYDLKRRFQSEDPVGFHYRASDGSLYPALKKLLRERQVTMRTERHGRRTRKVYAITRGGRERFLSMLREPAQPLFVFDEAQVKIYFSRHDPQAGLAHLERLRREDTEHALQINALAAELLRPGTDRFHRVVIEMVRALLNAKAREVERLHARLQDELATVGARNGRAHASRSDQTGRSRLWKHSTQSISKT